MVTPASRTAQQAKQAKQRHQPGSSGVARRRAVCAAAAHGHECSDAAGRPQRGGVRRPLCRRPAGALTDVQVCTYSGEDPGRGGGGASRVSAAGLEIACCGFVHSGHAAKPKAPSGSTLPSSPCCTTAYAPCSPFSLPGRQGWHRRTTCAQASVPRLGDWLGKATHGWPRWGH